MCVAASGSIWFVRIVTQHKPLEPPSNYFYALKEAVVTEPPQNYLYVLKEAVYGNARRPTT